MARGENPTKREESDSEDEIIRYVRIHLEQKDGHYVGDRCWEELKGLLKFIHEEKSQINPSNK